MVTISVYEAKTQLSRLLHQVERGEEVVIARDGKPVARLVGFVAERPEPRRYGAGEGRIWVADDFDVPEVDRQPIDPPSRAARSRRKRKS